MIVNYSENGWEVITQRAHGIVAAQLAFNWRVADRPLRWVETVLAIAEHDDAENELDGETLITAAGGPLNFDMKSFELPHCKKLASLTITKSRYIAILTSMHMEFLYGEAEPTSNEARQFLDEQRSLQATWRKELGLSKAESLRIYKLVEWCDALSLLICKGDMQPEERSLEISTGPDDKIYHLTQKDDNTLSINPWPFEANDFMIRYDSRLIKTIQFKSSKEFREAFLDAPITEKTWTIAKAAKPATPAKKRNKLKK
ncbi:MAG: DUF3891 family protein [Chitinophagaceae bacterium]|nr:MAG: DUF3891 family protein [Chitinophagaceae bacterium]